MIYATGDMHGQIERFSDKKLKSLKKGDTLIVCGDFGFVWNQSKEEKKILLLLGKKPYDIAFIDGAHENFELLDALEEVEWNGSSAFRVSGNLYYLPRGQLYEIEGNKCFVFGGGESPDREIRNDTSLLWDREMPTPQQMAKGISVLEAAGRTVDYVFTHEPPATVKGFLKIGEDKATHLNLYLDEISKKCTIKRWFFGSCHLDRVISHRSVAVFNHIVPVTMELSQGGKR